MLFKVKSYKKKIMKKILMGLMGFMGLMGIWSCDKIAEEDYTVYDGASVMWMTAGNDVPAVQRVLVEKFTGPRCTNCPTADATLAAIHDERVVLVSINHPTGQGVPFPEQPDMRTDGGTVWDNWYGINAIPAAYINRDKGSQYLGDMGTIGGAINQALNDNPSIAMSVTATQTDNGIDVVSTLKYVKENRDELTLTVALVEDSLVYRQLMPDGTIDDNYLHNHMLRKVITSYWGASVEASGYPNECVAGVLNFTPSSDVNLENCHIVAFVSDRATRRVLNCASCKITLPTDED